jgi:hypothetical protein
LQTGVENRPPVKPGVGAPRENQADPLADQFPSAADRLSRVASLEDLAEEYVLFTHALLFTHAYWPCDPIEEHIVQSNGACNPFQILLPRPVFVGCDARDPAGNLLTTEWNYRLVAVPKEEWQPLFLFLSRLMGSQSQKRVLVKTSPAIVRVPDVLKMEKRPSLLQLPLVPCVVFNLVGNTQSVHFAPELASQITGLVPVKVSEPDAQLAEFADCFFDGRPCPMSGTLEDTPEEAERKLRGLPVEDFSKVVSPKAAGDRERKIIKEMGAMEQMLRRAGL